MAVEIPPIVARNYSELVDALARIKNLLGLSNETLEQVAGLCAGHCDKLLGRSRQKRIGPRSLDLLLGALAIELVVRPNPEAVAKMADRWEKRNALQVRQCQPVSQAVIAKCRPIILGEMARKGWQTRSRQARNNGHNGHAK